MRKVQWSFMAAVVLAAAAAVAAGGEEHHVVGGDRGWEVSNDISSWSSARIFTVGDTIWFTYSAAHESVAELGSKKEYTSCDLTNPIRMYTNGIDKIPLDGEGVRYFASGNLESCNNGLKLPITVQSHQQKKQSQSHSQATIPADAPYSPSSSTRLNGFYGAVLLIALLSLAIFV